MASVASLFVPQVDDDDLAEHARGDISHVGRYVDLLDRLAELEAKRSGAAPGRPIVQPDGSGPVSPARVA